MASSICMMIDGWMPSVGSSSTSSRGRVTSARAMASCCAWPPDSSPAGRPIIVASAGNTSTASLTASASPPRARSWTTSRFSRTVRPGNTWWPWGT